MKIQSRAKLLNGSPPLELNQNDDISDSRLVDRHECGLVDGEEAARPDGAGPAEVRGQTAESGGLAGREILDSGLDQPC